MHEASFFSCNNCTKDFPSKDQFDQHIECLKTAEVIQPKLSQKQNIYCNMCDKSFKKVVDLENHNRSKHGKVDKTENGSHTVPAEEETTQKEACFTVENNDEIVIKVMKKCSLHSAKYSCNQCNVLFPTIDDLKIHDQVKHEDNFVCSFCNINFQSLENMDSHMDTVHESRWKMYDPDVLKEGDIESESDSDCSNCNIFNDSENEN